MRTIVIVALFAALVAGCQKKPSSGETASLTIFVVSKEEVPGGRFLDSPEYPRLGYAPAQPEMIITSLVAVVPGLTPAMQGFGERLPDGTYEKVPFPERPYLRVTFNQPDAEKFRVLSTRYSGKKLAFMKGDTLLFAPMVHGPIEGAEVQLDPGTNRQSKARKEIEQALKNLVP